MKQYFVYILTNKGNNVLYIGSTSDLVKRVYQHKNKLVEGFTEKYNIGKLVYYEIYSDPETMVNRERSMKNLVRRKKLDLINSMNSELRDLYEEIL
jgi:putative endonuclease